MANATTRPESLGLLPATFRVARLAPFHVLRGKRVLALLTLALLPALVVILLRAFGENNGLGVRGFVDFVTTMFFTVVYPVTLLFLGAAAIGDDVDNGTLLYLRLRPIPGPAIVVGRYLAACLSAFLLLAPALVLLYVLQVGYLGTEALFEVAPVLGVVLFTAALASLAYGAIFLLLSLLLRNAVILGLVFVAGWEGVVSKIPAPAAYLTVSFHMNALLYRATTEGSGLNSIMSIFEATDLIPSWLSSVLGLVLVSLVLIGIATVVFQKKEYL